MPKKLLTEIHCNNWCLIYAHTLKRFTCKGKWKCQCFLVIVYFMRNEFQFKHISLRLYRILTSGWSALGNKYRLSCRAPAYCAYPRDFLYQGIVELYLGYSEEGTKFKTRIYCMKIYVDHVSSHAVLLRTVHSITVQ